MDDSTKASQPSAVDPKIQAEWNRLEDKRISEERAEADVDAEEAHEHHFHQDLNRRFVWRAFTVALIAGLALAVFLNRSEPEPESNVSQAVAVQRAVDIWAEVNQIHEEALLNAVIRRIQSTAAVPENQRVLQVIVCDEKGRDRMESLLAASGLRIESDQKPVEGEEEIDSLVVSGPPAEVDALIDRFIASPTMLEVVSPALLAKGPPTSDNANQSQALARRPSSTNGATQLPTRIRLRVEVVESEGDDSRQNPNEGQKA
tara:strand:- start:38 stop:817 length:780 start_codon:yes stop_codon:yes gene_type:complete